MGELDGGGERRGREEKGQEKEEGQAAGQDPAKRLGTPMADKGGRRATTQEKTAHWGVVGPGGRSNSQGLRGKMSGQ